MIKDQTSISNYLEIKIDIPNPQRVLITSEGLDLSIKNFLEN